MNDGNVTRVEFAPARRCAECGGRATRTDGEHLGCADCFPHWPAIDNHDNTGE